MSNVLSELPDVDMISFTFREWGRALRARAETMKKLSLELGEKSCPTSFCGRKSEKALPYA
jgi:acyl-CoA reductase-like NAD-dependent aldehyde dehydrogenase